jgi:hypothetical protein
VLKFAQYLPFTTAGSPAEKSIDGCQEADRMHGNNGRDEDSTIGQDVGRGGEK